MGPGPRFMALIRGRAVYGCAGSGDEAAVWGLGLRVWFRAEGFCWRFRASGLRFRAFGFRFGFEGFRINLGLENKGFGLGILSFRLEVVEGLGLASSGFGFVQGSQP